MLHIDLLSHVFLYDGRVLQVSSGYRFPCLLLFVFESTVCGWVTLRCD